VIASRFWFGLLGLALSGALLVAFLAISMHDRLGVRMVSEGLSADSRVVSWYLRNEAREGAAQLIRFAANDTIARSLAEVSRASEGAEIDSGKRRQVKSALTRIASEMPKGEGFDAVFAVAQSGEVVAHIGFDQATTLPDFELGGYPVVADALHGYVRDDTLVFDRLYRVVARPVEFEVGQLPAGAIVGANVIDDAFASEVSERTGAAVAFYSSGRKQATGVPAGFDRQGLDQIVSDLPSLEQDADYKEKGRTDVHQFGQGLAVVYSRLQGEAWQLGAGYAVARQAPSVGGPLGVLKQADTKDKEAVSTLLLVAVALLATAIGVALSFWEYNAPLNAFRRQLKTLGAGVAHLSVDKLRGPFRQLGLDINLALDRMPRSSADEAPISVGFGDMFGEPPSQPGMAAFGLPGSAAGAAPSPAHAPQFAEPPAMDAGFIEQAPQAAMPAVPPRRAAHSRAGTQPIQAFGGDAYGGAQFAQAPAPPEPAYPPAFPESDMGYSPPAPAVAAAPVAHAAPEPNMVNGAGEVDPEWTRVYHDFVRIKQDCGEAIEGFTFERFTATLRKNRDTLMRDHGVQHVQFSAYVKQGRAALKAKPVRH
jgi:hypothetical protein